jgi:parallel beta-helix repeat protein
MRKAFVIKALVVALLVNTPASGKVINVPGDYDQIHDAVQACDPGDVVLVAPGVYYDCTHETEGPGSTPACVIMKSGVTLRGSGVDLTIIDAQQPPPDGNGRGIYIENVSNCRVENLQVRGAFAEVYGAGILIRQVDRSVILTDLKIISNFDGGLICLNGASPTLNRLEFQLNEAKQGGGISLEEGSDAVVIDCIIQNNAAPLGAGIMIRESSPYLRGCLIRDNTCNADNGNGGGINILSANPEITDCDILENTATGNGGGIAYQGEGGGLLSYCTVKGNIANGPFSLAGGIYCEGSSPELLRVFIVENSTTSGGADAGGMACLFSPSPSLYQCTLAGNAAGNIEGTGGLLCQLGATPTVANSIIAFSTQGQAMACSGEPLPSNPQVSCTNIFGNAGGNVLCGIDEGGNFFLDPEFCGTTGLEYSLEEVSPCAPGNHPGGPSVCNGDLIGAGPLGCGPTGLPQVAEAQEGILGNAPNPFNPTTSIFFLLTQPGPATLLIFDLSGRLISSYSWENLGAGRHEITWQGKDHAGKDVASGTYFYQLQAHGAKHTQRMSLIR